MLSSIYTKSYLKLITKRLHDTITYMPSGGVSVGFKDIFKKDKTTGEYTLRNNAVLPSISCYIFGNQDAFAGLGRWLTPTKQGIRRNPLVVIEVWARTMIERDSIASFVEQAMFQNLRYFQKNGIRGIELMSSQPKQYDPTDKIVMNVSHVMTQIQRWIRDQ